MSKYEYRVIPAPKRGKKVKGARSNQERFAYALTEVMNTEARNGWEYHRAESLPVEEKKSMLSSATESYQSVLVFRRVIRSAINRPEPALSETTAIQPRPSLRLGPADAG